MSVGTALAALKGVAATIAQTVADVENFALDKIGPDLVAAEAAVEKAIGPVIQEAEVVGQVLNGKLSAVGAVLQDLGLASKGPNVESSLEVNPGSNDRG